jgi:hypothetical protein
LTLSEYLSKLSDEDRKIFVTRIEAVGNHTVDAYSASLPKWYSSSNSHLDVDSVIAVYKHEGPGNSGHYHILMYDYQYAYWSDPKRKPPETWLTVASKADKDWLKPTTKADATIEDGPRHVFGSSVYDPDKRVTIFPGKQKERPIDIGAQEPKKDDN